VTGRFEGWRSRDHTQGSLLHSTLVLAVPMMISGIGGGALFQLVDLSFIAQLGDVPMASVIIVNQSVRQIIFMVVMGGSFGVQALIAREVGAGHPEAAEQVAGQAVVLGASFSVLVAIIGGLFPEALFSLPNPDPAFYAEGVPYLRLVFLLNFGVVGSMMFGSILGGAGDTTTPLLVMLVQTAVAILAEWVLIFGNLGAPALGVKGVALGVSAGQISAMAIGLFVLFRGGSRVHLRGANLIPDAEVLRRIGRLAWPPALQFVSGLAATVAFLRLAGHFGAEVQTAYAIGLRIGMIVPMVCFPLAGASATLVGQALGAGKPKRAWRALGVGLAIHGTLMFGFAAITFFFRTDIVSLLSDDPVVVRIGSEYFLYASIAMCFWAFHFPLMRALQGAGDMVVPMAISFAGTFLIAIPLAYGLALHTALGYQGIWIAFLTSTIVVTLATGGWVATGRWTQREQRPSMKSPRRSDDRR
jgi:putative MATE family efflux protein